MSLYVITGGAGFIGSHLADLLLSQGHRVRVLDDLSTGHRENLDQRCELVVGDVADRAGLDAVLSGAAGVFHLAAIASVARSNEDWLGTNHVNLVGTIAVFDAARAAGQIPVVYASSAAIYGDQGEGAVAEGAPPQPQTAYGADKLGSELHARVGWLVHKVPSFGFRFFNVYGPRQDPASPYSGVISIFSARALAGDGLSVHGDGQQSRDFVYVSDVVRHLLAGMERALREPGARVFNVCTGRSTTVLELAHTILRLAGQNPDVRFGPARTGDIRVSVGDPAAATARLGVAATVPLYAGLATTLASLRPAIAHAAE